MSVSCGVKTWLGGELESVWGGWGGAGGAPLGRSPGWSGRAGRPSAMPPFLLGAGRWTGGTGVWGPSWYWVPLRARTSCLSAGSGSRRSSVLFARSASRSLVLPRSLVAAVCFLGNCSGRWVCHRTPRLHSFVLRVPRCRRDFRGHPDRRNWGPGRSLGCTPCRFAGLRMISRRNPCLRGPGRRSCCLGPWGSPGPCRCTHGLHSLG